MSSSASISIELCDEEEAKNLLSSISPDNKPLPRGLALDCYVDGGVLRIFIESGRGLESLLATLDDLLVALGLAEQIVCKRHAKV